MEENIWVLDDSLRIRVYYDCDDCSFEDNVCISFREVSPENEKLFRAGETNIFLTPVQAEKLAQALIKATKQSRGYEETP